jgi:hypothetical protein
MSFLRRLLGGDDSHTNGATPPADLPDAIDSNETERLHERDLMRAEAERLDDLRRRQLKYADRAWTPPAQGGERRADDEDRAADR